MHNIVNIQGSSIFKEKTHSWVVQEIQYSSFLERSLQFAIYYSENYKDNLANIKSIKSWKRVSPTLQITGLEMGA